MSKPRPFADRLLTWFDRHGRHDLPWQHPRTPYRVWVSEIMLQQTQVQTVIPYFERFMDRFPDLRTLADSPQGDVLANWSGLGYYARARNLHKAAIECMEKHGGELPSEPDALCGLPGIGESTANAIRSQAWDCPAAVLDGNVRRVLARHCGIEGWPGKKQVLETMWRAARERVPSSRGADYTQAIMDLGATVCSRTRPGCGHCPVAEDCVARIGDRIDELPGRKPKTAVRELRLDVLVVQDPEGKVLLERRPQSGIWGGLWSLPEGESATGLGRALGVSEGNGITEAPLQHRLTHRLLDIRPVRVRLASRPGRLDHPLETGWFGPGQWPALGLPKPVTTLLNRLAQEKQT